MFTQSWTLFQELSHISAQSAIGRDSKKMKLNPVLSGTKYLPFIKSFFVYSWWLYLLRISSTCLNYVILNFFVFTLYFKAIRYHIIFFFFLRKLNSQILSLQIEIYQFVFEIILPPTSLGLWQFFFFFTLTIMHSKSSCLNNIWIIYYQA